MAEMKKQYIVSIGFGIFVAVVGFIVFIVSFAARADAGNKTGNAVMLVGFIIIALGLALLFVGIKAKKEYDKLKSEASGYGRY